MAPNPNPQRTTDPMWRFTERVVALEPDDFVFAGAYVRKSGYHATVADNLASWPGTYSVRLAADLRGPRDKGRALDVKSRQAAAGKAPTIMARYGARMRAAAKARDPRVRKWREVLGQFDVDTPPEAIDFQSTVERVPDNTHEWHFHWSILTEFVDDPEAYDAMYSVLIGQSLADYQQIGVDDMALTEVLQTGPKKGVSVDFVLSQTCGVTERLADLNPDTALGRGVAALLAAAAADEVRDAAVLATVKALTIATGADPQPVLDAIAAVRDEAHAGFTALQQQLAQAQARNVRMATAMAAAGVAFEQADDTPAAT